MRRHSQSCSEAKSIADELRLLLAPLSDAGVTVRTQIAEGNTASETVRHAAEHDVDLVVMGTHGRCGFDRLTLGSVAEKVLGKTPCPVLTIPPGVARSATDVSVRQILCPTDFSTCSEQAMDFALSLAERANATVTALRVVETIDARPELSGAMAELQKRRCDTDGQLWTSGNTPDGTVGQLACVTDVTDTMRCSRV